MRIPTDEAQRLAAAATNDTVSRLIRKAVAQMLEGGSGVAVVDRASSSAQLMTVRHGYGSSATEAFVIPDSPPSTVQGTEYSITSRG